MGAAGFDLGDRLPTLDAGRVRLRWLTDADVPALLAVFGDPAASWGSPSGGNTRGGGTWPRPCRPSSGSPSGGSGCTASPQ
jgi:hypothetical protein